MYFNLGYDMEQVFYSVFAILGALIVAVYNFFNFKSSEIFPSAIPRKIISFKKNKDLKPFARTSTVLIESLIITFLYYSSAGSLNVFLGNLLGTSANYFGMLYLAPILLFLGCYIAGLDVVKIFDMIAPTYPLGLIFTKTACFFAGCCSGIEWEHGLYNFDDMAYQVPVQLIEAALALLIFIILFSIRKQFKAGTGFPLYVILYSSTRFFSEFLRSEPNVFMGLKLYHFMCISGVVFGIIIYIIASKFSNKISLYFTENNPVASYITDGFDKLYVAYDKRKKRKVKKPIVHHKKKK